MIANVAPDISSCEHTMNTLRYADRVKQIKRNLTATAIAEQEHVDARKVHIHTITCTHTPAHTHTLTHIHIHMYTHTHTHTHTVQFSRKCKSRHAVATISRLLKMIGLFCKRAL